MPKTTRRKYLRKKERLHGKKPFDDLFHHGKRYIAAPIKALYSISTRVGLPSEPVEAAFSVPSKTFRRAVDRNVLKRRMREAYRINKMVVYDAATAANAGCSVVFIYISKSKLPYSEIESKLLVTLHHLRKKIEHEESADRAD